MLVGLRNSTHTVCWMNSLIQMLFSSTMVRDYLLNGELSTFTDRYLKKLLYKYLAEEVNIYHFQFAAHIGLDASKYQCPAEAFDKVIQLTSMKSMFELKLSDVTTCKCAPRSTKYESYSTDLDSGKTVTKIDSICGYCGYQRSNTYNIEKTSDIIVIKSTTHLFEYGMRINGTKYEARSFILKPHDQAHYITAVVVEDNLVYIDDEHILTEYNYPCDVILTLYEKIETDASIDRYTPVMADEIVALKARIAALEAENAKLNAINKAKDTQIARYKKQQQVPQIPQLPLQVHQIQPQQQPVQQQPVQQQPVQQQVPIQQQPPQLPQIEKKKQAQHSQQTQSPQIPQQLPQTQPPQQTPKQTVTTPIKTVVVPDEDLLNRYVD